MKDIFKEFLFDQNYLVSEDGISTKNHFEVIFSLASLFNVRIVSNETLAQKEMIPFISEQYGIDVPTPFYQGFPKSVKSLSSDDLLFDQFIHYMKTYDFGMVDEAGHSLFENYMERTAFKEESEIENFFIITESEAKEKLIPIVSNLLLSTRPLNNVQYEFVLEYIREYGFNVKHCKSKNTAIRLLADSHNLQFIQFITMADVIKLVDEINYQKYNNDNIKKLNLKNQDRKFITKVIDTLFELKKCNIKECSEKKAIWNGLLHHLHYKPHNELSNEFVTYMRGQKNISIYSQFEKEMAQHNIKKAVKTLKEEKSSTEILRKMNYLVSRCSSLEEVQMVLDAIEYNNVIVLIQLIIQYASKSYKERQRYFTFTKNNMIIGHQETVEEAKKRKSMISEEYADMIYIKLKNGLQEKLKGRLGKVYIDSNMKLITLPLQENVSQSGLNVLPKGSRIKIDCTKKIRAFTYWERVNDIDLSIIGFTKDGEQVEFSWRTMFDEQSDAICFSGDQTSGYTGGSEYYDINIQQFKKEFPNMKYLIFCNNVYSCQSFNSCFCKAGYMLRDIDDTGEVFEPKTVQSSYLINCNSTFAYLFGIDLEKNELVWLNMARQGKSRIAGETNLGFLTKYFDLASIINMYSFFEMMATEVVDNPNDAQIIISDEIMDYPKDVKIIRSCDFDKILAIMNKGS
ncbi:MAG: hypothetical protein ACI4U3_08270 [Traorella sp.]